MPHFIFIQQISVLNILNMLYNLHFFSSKFRLFHNATLFGFCIAHILNTGCAKIWKKKIRRQKVNLISINKALIIRPNTTHRPSTIIFYYTLQHVSAYPDQPSSGRCRVHKNKYRGRDASLYSVMNYNIIIPKTE